MLSPDPGPVFKTCRGWLYLCFLSHLAPRTSCVRAAKEEAATLHKESLFLDYHARLAARVLSYDLSPCSGPHISIYWIIFCPLYSSFSSVPSMDRRYRSWKSSILAERFGCAKLNCRNGAVRVTRKMDRESCAILVEFKSSLCHRIIVFIYTHCLFSATRFSHLLSEHDQHNIRRSGYCTEWLG